MEYEGRATVARFMIMEAYGNVPAPEIRDKYLIYGVPIVILFNHGVEVKRWWLVYAGDVYRYDIDKLVEKRARWWDWR